MQAKLSKVIIALAVVIALVGAVSVVSADMTTDAADAPVHSGDGSVGHVADGVTEMNEMTHMGEQMNDRERGEHHAGHHHGEDHGGSHHGQHHAENHHGSDHGYC